jgi:hypothetical protein
MLGQLKIRVGQFVGQRVQLKRPALEYLFRAIADVDPKVTPIPDSLTPEFVLLVQQQARLALVRSMARHDRIRPREMSAYVGGAIRSFVALRVINALTQSYLNEHRLMEKITRDGA